MDKMDKMDKIKQSSSDKCVNSQAPDHAKELELHQGSPDISLGDHHDS